MKYILVALLIILAFVPFNLCRSVSSQTQSLKSQSLMSNLLKSKKSLSDECFNEGLGFDNICFDNHYPLENPSINKTENKDWCCSVYQYIDCYAEVCN